VIWNYHQQRVAQASPTERLEGVLRFLGQDLDHIREEWRGDVGYEWLSAATEDEQATTRLVLTYILYAVLPRGEWRIELPGEPMTEAALRALQAHLRAGVEAVLRGEPWELPAVGARCLRTREGVTVQWTGEVPALIAHGLAQLVVEHGDRVRACKECGRLFLAVKRQEYDRPACGFAYRARQKGEPPKETR
jgi:hypothetical protein